MQIKSSAIATMPKFVTEKQGETGQKGWLDALSPQAKQVYGGYIMAYCWYPFRDLMVEPTQKLCDMFYGGSSHGASEAGRFSADIGLSGVNKIFVKAGSPDFILKWASTIMAGYYQPSELKVVESVPDKALIQINGCKNVVITTPKSLTKGDPVTEYVIKWSE